MQKQFQFLLLFLVSIAAVNNLVGLDRAGIDSAREQQLYVATELFRTQIAAKWADQAMTLSAAHLKRVLNGAISIGLANGARPEEIAAYIKLNKVMLVEGLNFRNNCRILTVDQKNTEKKLAKAEFVGEVAEGIRLAAHREISACNMLEQARYIKAVGAAARAHSISVIAQNAVTDAHKELDYILLCKQQAISEFSRTVAIAAWQSYQ
jgi:hypothetical protein